MSDNLFFTAEEWQRVYGNPQAPAAYPTQHPAPPTAQPLAPTPTAPITGTPLAVAPPPPRTQLRAVIDVQALFESQYLPPYQEQAAEKIYEALNGAIGPWYPEIRSLVTKIEVIGPERPAEPQPRLPDDKVSFIQFAEVIASVREDLTRIQRSLAQMEAERAVHTPGPGSPELPGFSRGGLRPRDGGGDAGTLRARGVRAAVPGDGNGDSLFVTPDDVHPDGPEPGGGAADRDRKGPARRAGTDTPEPRRKATPATLTS